MAKISKKTLADNDYPIEGLYQLNIKDYWRVLKAQPFAFWAIILCVMNEYLRIQSLFPILDGLPLSSTLIYLSLFSWIANSKEKYQSDNFLWLIVAFLIIVTISSLNAYDSSVSFKFISNFYSWVLIYFLIVQNVKTEKRLLIFTWFIFLPIFKISLHGATSWAARGFAFSDWGVRGPEGYFANSGELSLLMAMFFAMSLGLYIGFKDRLSQRKRLFLILLPITAIMTVLASATRGSQLALLIQILILGILYKKFSFRGIIITVLVLFLGYSYLPAEQKARFESAGTDTTSKARLTYWAKGYEMLQDHPFTGVGYFNFPVYFDYYYAEYKVFKDKSEAAHNHIVEVGATLGYPGLILYLMIIWGCYKVSGKIRKLLMQHDLQKHWIYSFTIGMDCALVGYFIGAMFMSVAFYPYIWIHSAYIVSVLTVTKNIVEQKKKV